MFTDIWSFRDPALSTGLREERKTGGKGSGRTELSPSCINKITQVVKMLAFLSVVVW